MSTVSALVDRAEALLGDPGNATWTAADIERWLIDAIADAGQHFPLTKSQQITTSLDDRQYDLNADFLAVVSVEYPAGEDPPRYLDYRPYQHPKFWQEPGNYSVLKNDQAGDNDELLIAQKPAAGQGITVVYQAHHDLTVTGSQPVTIQPEYEHILLNYVVWQALLQLKHTEEASPTSNSSLLMSQYAVNADRARRAYVDSLAKAVFASSRSRPVSWAGTTEEMGRIY